MEQPNTPDVAGLSSPDLTFRLWRRRHWTRPYLFTTAAELAAANRVRRVAREAPVTSRIAEAVA